MIHPSILLVSVTSTFIILFSACNEGHKTVISTATLCVLDQDCVGRWHPEASRCGSIERCENQECTIPPSVSGNRSPLLHPVELLAQTEESTLIHRFDVEIAQSPFELMRGLMCRKSIISRRGLLLRFGPQIPPVLTGRLTFVPIGALAFSETGTLLGHALITPDRYWHAPDGTIHILEIRAEEADELLLRYCGVPLGSDESTSSLSCSAIELNLTFQ